MSIVFAAEAELGPFVYNAAFEADREITVLFGHSGAGKSVSLQMAAGLLRPRRAHIEIDGRVVDDTGAGIFVPPQERNVGYVVQNLALFPNMNVAENIRFGMPGHIDQRARLGELMGLLGLTGYEERMPQTLSGGQQQRVALARALARDARLLLLDEPFSALDESLREGLRHELLRLRHELGLTIVFVTHDLREAHLLADRVAVFDEGQVLQFGPREDVFRRPRSRRVAELTGFGNICRGKVTGHRDGYVRIEVEGLVLEATSTAATGDLATGDEAWIGIRAERVNLRRIEAPGPNQLMGRVETEFAYGNTHTLTFAPLGPGPSLRVELAARPYEVLGVAEQREWVLELPAEDLQVMPK